MSSFVGRLARTLSGGGEGMHHRVASAPEAIEVPKAEAVKPRMSSSPSFNDFSLRVEEDGKAPKPRISREPGRARANKWGRGLPVKKVGEGGDGSSGTMNVVSVGSRVRLGYGVWGLA